MRDVDEQALRDELVGKRQGWLDRCREAVTKGPQAVVELAAELVPDDEDDWDSGSEIYRALTSDSSTMKWFDEPPPVGDHDVPTPELAAATAIIEVAAELTGASLPTIGEPSAAGAGLTSAMAHFDRSGISSAGSQLMSSLTTDTRLSALLQKVLTSGTYTSRGFIALLALELAGQRPRALGTIEVPVLFQGSLKGEAGTLKLTRLSQGPVGLHPDPAMMSVFQADPLVSAGAAEAWAVSSLSKEDACVVWSVVTRPSGDPCSVMQGNSMSAAFVVALDDLAPKLRLRRWLRLRLLDPNSAVTAGLDGQTLTPVAGYPDKMRAAKAESLRVVVAQSALESAREAAPSEFRLKITGAVDAEEVIKATRDRRNKTPFILVIVALVMMVLSSTAVLAAHYRSLSTELAATANQLSNSDSRTAALLALTADQLHSSDATESAMRNVVDNNRSVLASTSISDQPVRQVAATRHAVFAKADNSDSISVLAPLDLSPIGEIPLPASLHGMGGGDDLLAVVAGSELSLYQGREGNVPDRVESFPLAGLSGRIFGPVVNSAEQSVVVFDDTFKGVFWRPGMSEPEFFDVDFTTDSPLALWERIVAVSANWSDDKTLALGTDQNRVLLFTVEVQESDERSLIEAGLRGDLELQDEILRKYTVAPYHPASFDEVAISSVGITDKGAIMVGTEEGFRHFPRASGETNVDTLIRERVNQVVPVARWQGEGFAYLTGQGAGFGNDSRAQPLVNIDQSASMHQVIVALSAHPNGSFVAGRADGRVVIFDPSNSQTELLRSEGTTAVSFTREGLLAKAEMDYGESSTARGLSLREVSVEADQRDRELAASQGELGTGAFSTGHRENFKFGSETSARNEVNTIDASAARISAGGWDRNTGLAKVWLWNRLTPDSLPREFNFTTASPRTRGNDITHVSLAPDDSRLVAFNPRRGEITAWDPDSGEVIWSQTVTVNSDERTPIAAEMSVDREARHGILGYFDPEEKYRYTWVDLETGELKQLEDIPSSSDMALSPSGEYLAVASGNDLLLYSVPAGDLLVQSNLRNTGGKIAWSPEEDQLAVNLMDTNQVLFLNPDNLQESAPRWRLSDFPDSSRISDMNWSQEGGFLAVSTASLYQGNTFKVGDVRILHTDAVGMKSSLCAIAGSELSKAEWAEHVGRWHPQRSVCVRD